MMAAAENGTAIDAAGAAMESLSDEAARPGKPRVVILGGGVAGLTAAYELRRHLADKAEITVVSESDHFVLGPALLWVPFGRAMHTLSFPLARPLTRHGITFMHARAEHIDPEQQIVLAQYQNIPYDYLLVATGPRADGVIPGVSGQFNATESIWSERTAGEARGGLEQFLNYPGPVVIGAAPGAQYLNVAYEFALSLDYLLRHRGLRGQATITFITPEPYLGHLDVGASGARRQLERLFNRRHIRAHTGTAITRVDRDGVHLDDGQTLPATYTMIIPPFSGAVGIWKSPGIANAHGFVPVDGQYRHMRYHQIYAAGVAAQTGVTSPLAENMPKTGYLAAAMARRAARNISAAITGGMTAARPLPRLFDLRILDGGDAGVLLLAMMLGRPWRLALPLPGRSGHWLKTLLARYLLWKLRTGRAYLP